MTSDALDEIAAMLERRVLIESLDAVSTILESLKQEKHAAALAPQRAKMERLLTGRWKRQTNLLLHRLDSFLRQETAHITEAKVDPALKARLQAVVTAHINYSSVFEGDTTAVEALLYEQIITDVMVASVERMTLDYALKLTAETGQRAIQSYLDTRAFSKLAADIDQTTKGMIRNALVETFAADGTYQEAVAAINGAMEEMSAARANVIAQTELNAAYNKSLLASAQEVSGTLKRWEPDGEACKEICTPNVQQGWIPVDEDFDSGDDSPPAHPSCDCSVSFKFPRRREQEE